MKGLNMQKKHIPNALTLFRYIAIVLLLACWQLPQPHAAWCAFAVMLLACISDFLDGFLARRWGVQSELGRLLDPNADKLLIATALLLLASEGVASVVAVALILCRELFVSGLREYSAHRQLILHVTTLAKWKTTLQMIACIALLLQMAVSFPAWVLNANDALLWLATAITLITGIEYWRKVKPYLTA
jgi:cardiolipin synthase (CMP-forming)